MKATFQRLSSWVTDWNPYEPAKLKDKGLGIEPILIEASQMHGKVARLVVITFLIFIAWAFLAPLDGGVVITGTVTVSGNRKAVQHPGGGVVQDLLVHEGSIVKVGDVVVKVNPLESDASLTGAELQYINLLTSESRLQAERVGSDIRWKPELADFGANDTRVAEAKLVQTHLFSSRRVELESQRRILSETLVGQEAQARSSVKVMAEKRSQLELVASEARNTSQLAKEGFVPESKANEVLRSQSSLQSDMANLGAEAIRLQSSIASTQLQIVQLRISFNKDIDNQLTELQKNRETFSSRMESLKFNRNLTDVKAPVGGVVTNLKVNTIGGVISSGQILMEIVPEGGSLIVEGKIPLNSIDKVRKGLPADLRFSAFNQNTTPIVPGVITLVGADKLLPIAGGEEYYLAQVEITEEGLRLLGKNRIQAGMPVEVVVKTGERSFMTYLLKPLSDRFARSFKED
jgi:protease secretion system membrane fusion protein